MNPIQSLPSPMNPAFYPEEESKASLRDILYILFRHKWKIILLTLLAGIIAVMFVNSFPELFQCSAVILVKIDSRDSSSDSSVMNPIGEVSFPQQMLAEISILKSPNLAEMTVDKITAERIVDLGIGRKEPLFQVDDLYQPFYSVAEKLGWYKPKPKIKLTDREIAVKYLLEHISPREVGNNIEVAFQCGNPEIAYEVMCGYLDSYFLRRKQIHGDKDTKESVQFFEKASNDAFRELTLREEEIKKIQTKFNVGDLENQRTALINRIAELEQSISASNIKINSINGKITLLRNKPEILTVGPGESSEPGNPNDTNTDPAYSRLVELKLKESELATKYQPTARELVDLRNQIKMAEDVLASRKNSAISLMQVDGDMEKKRLDLLTTELNKARNQLNTLTEVQLNLARLKREQTEYETEYSKLRENLQRAQISSHVDLDKINNNVKIIQPAIMPLLPVDQNKKRNIGMGLFGGFALGIVLAFALDYLNQSIKTEEDVKKRLKLPVLDSVPYSKTAFLHSAAHNGNKSGMRKLPSGSAGTRVIGAAEDAEISQGLSIPITITHPVGFLGRNFPDIGKQMLGLDLDELTIQILQPDSKGIIIMFIGSQPQEGTSTLIREFAMSTTSNLNKSVLLLDADLQQNTPSDLFHIQPEYGWEDVLQNGRPIEDVIYQVGDSSMFISRFSVKGIADKRIFDLSKIDRFFELLKSHFDLILIDAPPATQNTSGIVLSGKVDQVVLVVEAEKTRWQVVNRTIEWIEKQGGNITGVVINKRRYPIPKFIYKRL